MAKMINVDELIEFCNTSLSMLHEHYNSVACAALRGVVEFAKEYAVEAEPDNGWISVKDRLPEDDVSILICSKRKTISKATYSSDMGRYYIADSDLWYNELDVTHWQPLPKPPKGE